MRREQHAAKCWRRRDRGAGDPKPTVPVRRFATEDKGTRAWRWLPATFMPASGGGWLTQSYEYLF